MPRRLLKRNVIAAAFILVLPLPALFWLPAGSVLAHGPVHPWPDAAGLFAVSKGYLFAWLESSGFGGSNTEPAGVLFFLYAAALSLATGDTHLAQSIMLYLGYSGCLAGVYFLARTLGLGAAASLSAAAFYMLNPIVFSGMPASPPNIRLLPYHAGTPILLALAVRFISGGDARKRLSLFAVAALFLGSPGYSSLQYFALTAMMMFVYSAYRLIRSDNTARAGVIARAGVLFTVFIVMNAYWLGLFVYDLGDAYASRLEPGYADADLLRGFGLGFLQGFMMLPVPELAGSFQWVSEYYKTSALAALFVLVSVGAYSFLSIEGREKAIFPGMLFVLSLFLAKGTKPPFASLGEAFFLSHPYMTRLFRNPSYFELAAILAFSLLVGVGIGELLKKARSASPGAAIAVALMLAASWLAYGKVFIAGGAVRSDGRAGSSQFNFVPDYYRELAGFLRADGEYTRVASIPAFTRQDWLVAYGWERRFLGGQFLNLWSGKPLVRPIYPGSAGVNPLFDAAVHPEPDSISPESWLWLMRVAGAGYVTLHGDTDTELLRSYDESIGDMEEVYGFVRNSPYIEKAGDFGPIELYRLREGLRLPKAYAAKRLDIVKEARFEDSAPLLSFLGSRKDPLLVFSGQQPSGVIERIEASGIGDILAPAKALATKSYDSRSNVESRSAVGSFTVAGPGGVTKGLVFYDADPGEYKKISFQGVEGPARLIVTAMPKYRTFALKEDFAAVSPPERGLDAAGGLISMYAPQPDGEGRALSDPRFKAVRSGERITVVNHSARPVVTDLGLTMMPLADTEEVRAFISGREFVIKERGAEIPGRAPMDIDLKGVLLQPGGNDLRIYAEGAEPPDEESGSPVFGLERLLRTAVRGVDPGPREYGGLGKSLSASPGGIRFAPDARCVDGYLAGFAMDVDKVGLDRFPLFSMEYSLQEDNGQGIELSFMIDTDGDGKGDIAISRALRARASGRPERHRTDMMRLLRAHTPGQEKASLTGIGFIAHCDGDERPAHAASTGPGFRLRSIGIYSRQSEKGTWPLDPEPPVVAANGVKMALKPNEEGTAFSADLPSRGGSQLIEVFEKGETGVYSLSIEQAGPSKGASATVGIRHGPDRGYDGPLLHFQRINPARYVVRVSGARKGFALAFLEAYHPGWRAYIGEPGRKDSGSVLIERLRGSGKRELDTHFVANGYANGWLVPDEAAHEGEFAIIIEYGPQAAMEGGRLVSAAGLISVLAFALFRDRGRR